jgi:hypothetical protein
VSAASPASTAKAAGPVNPTGPANAAGPTKAADGMNTAGLVNAVRSRRNGTGGGGDPRRYMRIAAELRAQISSGGLVPGDKLPPIGALIRDRKVSRETAGKGLQVLEQEGLVMRVPGLGYYVAARHPAD